MPEAFSQPVICPVLVGRQDALTNLRALVRQPGEPGKVVLVSGEAGIGKTRLLAELADEVRRSSHNVIRARFIERDVQVPYAGITRMLDDLLTANAAAPKLLAPFAAELTLLSPRLGRFAGRQSAPAAEQQPELEKWQILEAVTKLVRAVAGDDGAMLAFEDLHWADASSLEALLQLAREPVPGCLVVLTYRNDEVSPALGALLAQLDRERLAAELRLNRLGLSDVDRMLRAILGADRATRAEFLHAVFRLTDGNPFFVEEVLRSFVDQAGGIAALNTLRLADFDVPRGVNEAVQRRTVTLSQPARDVLALAAVAGVHFDFPLLRELSGLSERELLAIVKELIAAQLVAEEAEDVFVFRHALTREAIRTKLLLRERRALSRQIAQAIETLHGGNLESWLEDLAWHYNEAGDWAKASQYAREAGARALALYTPTAAAVHLTQAVDAGRRVDGTMMAEVFRLRGIAYEGAGDLEAARADYEQAISLAEAEGDHTTRWRALLDLGLFWSSRDFQQSGPYLRAALDVAREHGDAAALGHSLNRLGNWYSNTGDIDMARQMGEEALATFRAAGNQEGEAQTLDVLGMTSYQALELARGAAYYRQAIPLLQAIGDRRILTSALASIQIGSGTYQTDMLPPVLSLKEGSEYGEQALALARQSGSRSAESYALWHLVLSLGPQGEYARALTYGREALTIAHDTGHTQWDVAALCALSTWFLDLLATDDALRYLARAAARLPEIRSKLWDGQVDSLLLDTFVYARRIDEAAKLVASLPPSKLEMCTSFGDCQRYTSIAEFRLAQGDLDCTFSMLARLTEVAEHAVPGGAALRLIRLRGRALAAAGDHEEAIRCLRGAEALARQRGNLSYTWRLNVDLAAVLLAAAARDAARAAAGKAIETIESLAPRIPEQPLREQFIARALDMLPASLRHQPARDDAGLTGREAEVAALVAQGHTNREIADRLVLSVRTVETHVANAIAKLGLANRAQLAGWAVEHGLRTADT